jgi:hypothetical protein
VFVGSPCEDRKTKEHVAIEATSAGVFLTNLNGSKYFIPVTGKCAPGAKLTATQTIDVEIPRDLLSHCEPGGGAFNQSVRFAEHNVSRGRLAIVPLVDSSDSRASAQIRCRQLGVRLTTLRCHNSPTNFVVSHNQDRVIVRSPIVRLLNSTTRTRRQVMAAISNADAVVVASPKDAQVALSAFEASPMAHHYLQLTGSLAPPITCILARQSFCATCSADDLVAYARSLDVDAQRIDELSPQAPEDAYATLTELRSRGLISCRVAAVTLGKAGCVVVDFALNQAHAVQLMPKPQFQVAPTPCGAGDHWHAEWVFQREVEGLRDPMAATRATEIVAREVGMPKRSSVPVAATIRLGSVIIGGNAATASASWPGIRWPYVSIVSVMVECRITV